MKIWIKFKGVLRYSVLARLEKIRAYLLTGEQRVYERLAEKQCELHARYVYLSQKSSRVHDFLQRQEYSIAELTEAYFDAARDMIEADRRLDLAGERISIHTFLQRHAG